MASTSSNATILLDEEEVHINAEEEDEQQQQQEAIMMTPKKSKDGDVLHVGSVFHSIEAAEESYQAFAHINGFSIRRRNTYFSRSKEVSLPKEVLGVLFACVCEGTHKLQKQRDDIDGKKARRTSTFKTDCHSRMRIKRCPTTNEWICSVFDNDHNHAMVSPDKRNLMRSRRRIPESAKDMLSTLQNINIPASKVVDFYGEDATFDKKDVWNHMRWLRKIHYEDKDADGVKTYFMQMAANDPQFFYAIQCDGDGRAANFFWVSADAREAYRQFGDAVTFDTTYKTNKYCMPFAPFTGVNHHRQSILFGCALLENEQEYTFFWLFETWLQAMGGKAPISIITDQDVAMGNAIARVFPHTRHRLCLWHIKKKFGEKLGQVYAKRSNFKRAVKKCTRGARSVQDFEDQWTCLMREYGLEDHSWLNHMYAIRSSWIPIYFRDTFFAGMNTTQRSESMNSFFGAFVNSSTDLMGFVTKYDYAIESIRKRETREDHESRNKGRVLHNKDPILAQAAKVYTRNMFNIVAKEVEEVVALDVEEKSVDGDIHTLLVQYKVVHTEEWVVTFNLASKMGSCDCLKFEFEGIPCRHLMKVFEHFRIYEIPSTFILGRWCKYANRSTLLQLEPIQTNTCGVVARAARVSELCKLAYQVAHQCGESEIGYMKFKEAMLQLSVDAQEINDMMLQQENNGKVDSNAVIVDNCTSEPGVVGTATSRVDVVSSRVDVVLSNPNISITKGRKRGINQEMGSQVDSVGKNDGDERWKSGLEIATGRKRLRRCRYCHKLVDHDIRNCPLKALDNSKQDEGNKRSSGVC